MVMILRAVLNFETLIQTVALLKKMAEFTDDRILEPPVEATPIP